MQLNIKITTSDCCKVIIQDLSQYVSEDDNTVSKGEFKFSDTISIDVLQHNKSHKTTYSDPEFTLHTKKKQVQIPVKFDGWFTVVHLVLPTKEWFEREKNKTEGSALNLYNIVYYSDGQYVYKYIKGEISKATIEELIEVNVVDTTISKIEEDYISICFLRKCYINLCKQIFNSRGFSPCWNKNNIDSDLIFRRDLVWMAINVIKYLTECNQLAEVQRLVEMLESCNGVCVSSDVTSKTSGCGCCG